jgi:hypothetical protein
VLIDGLPPESLTKTAIRDSMSSADLERARKADPGGHGQWSHLEMLTASVIDSLGYVRAAVIAAGGGKPDEVKPIPRPGVTKPRTRMTSAQAAWFSQSRAEHAARQEAARQANRRDGG